MAALAFLTIAALATSARAVIVVYDIENGFSDVNNPSGVWSYKSGNTLLAHFSPVPVASLVPAFANGYWGTSGATLDGAVMLSTAAGGAAPPWLNNDFLSGEIVVRSADPPSVSPVVITFTAPSNGSLTYNGAVWYANSAAPPAINDFKLTHNAGPILESGSVLPGQDRFNNVGFVNGFNVVNVVAGDTLSLEIQPAAAQPFGALTGVGWVIDFTPVPEPGTLGLLAIGLIGVTIRRFGRR
jgi:hypothetical protein